MFNRNLNGRQFPDLDLDAPAAPQPGGSAPTHAKGESIPFAGGTFNVAANMLDEGGYSIDKGAFISQSAQTVIPGTLTRSKRGGGTEFNSTPEQKWGFVPHEVKEQDPNNHIGIRDDWGEGEVSIAVGYQEMEPVAHEKVGETIRHLRGKREA